MPFEDKGVGSGYYPQLLSADPLATGSVLAEGMDSNGSTHSTTTVSDHSCSVGVSVEWRPRRFSFRPS
jgi:hypothetical protein